MYVLHLEQISIGSIITVLNRGYGLTLSVCQKGFIIIRAAFLGILCMYCNCPMYCCQLLHMNAICMPRQCCQNRN